MKRVLSLMIVATLVFSMVGCGNNNTSTNNEELVQTDAPTDVHNDTPTEAPTPKSKPTPKPTPKPKPTPVLKIGKTVKNKDWKIKLTNAYTSRNLKSKESRTYWEAESGQAFLVLEMNITCRNSSKKPVVGDALADLVATTSDGNSYSSWEYKYINSEIWCFFMNSYLEANMPIHAYIYTAIPVKQMKKKVTVSLKLAGKKYKIKVNKRK